MFDYFIDLVERVGGRRHAAVNSFKHERSRRVEVATFGGEYCTGVNRFRRVAGTVEIAGGTVKVAALQCRDCSVKAGFGRVGVKTCCGFKHVDVFGRSLLH